MFMARVICSDARCDAELEIEASSPDELETLVCSCGCALEVVAWADWLDEPLAA
jgi:hypothetical protein